MAIIASRGSRATRRAPATVFVLLALSLGVPAVAGAATNGVIAFQVSSTGRPSLATVTADGMSRFAIAGAPAGSANVAWSADGAQLAFSSPVDGADEIFTMNSDGTHLRQVTSIPRGAIDPTWSPDGTQLAFADYADILPAIGIVDLHTLGTHRITSDAGASDRQPRWSPDGGLIAFSSNRTGAWEITTVAPTGADETTVTTQPGNNFDPAWSPGGSEIAYTNNLGLPWHIFAVARGGGPPRGITTGTGVDQYPAWSPDGTQIAFIRDGDLYTVASTGETGTSPVSLVTGAASDPSWGPAPTPVLEPVAGSSTASTPASGTTRPVTNAVAVPVGTTVNSTTGTSQVVFKPLTTPLAAPPAVATVQGGRYTLVARTNDAITLKVAPPACARRTQATAASPNRSGGARVHVRGGHVRVLSGYVLAGSGDPPVFTFTVTCTSTSVRVSRGTVRVTLTGRRHRVGPGRRGGRPHFVTPKRAVALRAGQTLLAPATAPVAGSRVTG